MTSIYVLEAHQKKGVGLSLMKAMAEAFISNDYDSVTLWVLENNLAARSFYDALHGKVVDRHESKEEDVAINELAYGWSDLHKIL
ncbi:GNAT family N-acetyltransferase [Methylobacterium sp. BTF04]|uniref:GNAT family N-acetyltransferase n=1 Tax=Methylobacterium sp. BTF04 TaxID=2708300 RepID=UPI0032B1A8BE